MWSRAYSTTFRLSLLAVPLHMLAGWALLAFVYVNTLSIMERRVDTGLSAEHQRLSEDMKLESRKGLIEALQARMQAERGSSRLYLLEDEIGNPLAANFSLKRGQPPDVWTFADAQVLREPENNLAHARLYSIELPRHLRLVLGRDLAEEEPFRRVVEESLAFAVPLTFFLAIIGGTLTSRAIVKRLSGFNVSARRILHGDITERLPVSRKSDEFDHLAENLNEALDRIAELMSAARQVTNNIAHDLRSPLSRIRNRLELALLSANSEEEMEEILTASVADIDSLLDTFEALLSIARLDHGLTSDLHPTDLVGLIEDLADYYLPLAEEKNLTLETSIAAPLGVNADQHLLFQALSNIVENAVHYTPDGGRIVISLGQIGNEVAITVADNGPGIPPDMYENVLKRFVRLDSSRHKPGNGLGLSVVRAVAQHHHARLVLGDNAPGLKVTMYFPPLSDSIAN